VQSARAGDAGFVWSVTIPAFNAERYLGQTLQSVLEQADDRVQIVVLDDHCSDRTIEIAKQIGGDRVEVRANAENLGAIATFNACINAASGRLVHILHADDRVRPGFYAVMERAMADNSKPSMASCRTQLIDEHSRAGVTTRSERDGSGVWLEALTTLGVSNCVRPPGVVVPRDVYDTVGSFRPDLPHAADWEMWARLAAAGPVWFEDQVLAEYRQHGAQDTAARVRTGDNIRERVDCVAAIGAHLPQERRRSIAARALAYSGVFAARSGANLIKRHEWRSGLRQFQLAAVCMWRAARTLNSKPERA